MPRETAEDKAIRLLAGQRIRFSAVSPVSAAAEVRGETGDYMVTMAHGRWECDCPATGHQCSHIRAARHVYRAVAPALEPLRRERRDDDGRGADWFGN